MKKKYKPSDAEIANDPSLKWHPYCRGEAIISDEMGGDVRFLEYKDGQIQAADMVLRPLPNLLSPLKVRRHTIMPNLSDEERKAQLAQNVASKILARKYR